jgi:phage gp37-like protein
MASVIRAVPGVAAAHYPAPDALETSPAVVLFWGGTDEATTIDHGPDQQWVATVLARVLVAHLGDTPSEYARIDELITPIVDAFAADGSDETAVERTGWFGGTASGHVSRVLPVRVRPSLRTTYAGEACYAADIVFDVKVHRNGDE